MSGCFSNIKCESINYRIKMQECQLNSAAIGRLYVGEMGDGDVYCGPEEGEDLRVSLVLITMHCYYCWSCLSPVFDQCYNIW